MKIGLSFGVSVHCDGPGCDVVGPRVSGFWRLMKRARRVSARFGWQYRRGLGDFWPACASDLVSREEARSPANR